MFAYFCETNLQLKDWSLVESCLLFLWQMAEPQCIGTDEDDFVQTCLCLQRCQNASCRGNPKKTLGQAFAKFAALLVVEPYRRSTVLHRGVKPCHRCSPLPRQCGVPKCDHEHSSMQHTPSSAIDSAPTCTQYDVKIAKPCLHSYSLCLRSSSFNIAIHYVYIISFTLFGKRYHFLSNMHLFIP